jgi:hypothetical protein
MIVQEGFRFGLGHPVLEFLATLAGRFGEPHERLAEPSDLERWLEQAGLAAGVRCDERLLGEARRVATLLRSALDSVDQVGPRAVDEEGGAHSEAA